MTTAMRVKNVPFNTQLFLDTAAHQSLLKAALTHGIFEIAFTKVNGDLRVMQATRDQKSIPVSDQPHGEDNDPFPEDKKSTRDAKVLVVYDVGNQGWRSMRWSSIISIIGKE
jgi:hypothetical protein